MRHRGPEARGGDARAPARVVDDADDPGRALVAGGLEAELLDQVRVGRAPRHRRRPRVRDVGEQRAERDDQLDAELAREVDDQAAERAPAQVRLDAEEQDGVAVHPVWARVVEDRLRPVDPAREPLLELHVRARRLEVVEALGVDLGEPPRVPALGEVAGCERGALAAVVPAPERSDQDRTLERRAASDVELRHSGQSTWDGS